METVKVWLSKRSNRAIQLLAIAVPLLVIGYFSLGGAEWVLSFFMQAGQAIAASGLFYSVYRVTAYERIHEIAEEDKARGDKYRLVMLGCYALIFAACFM